MRTKLAAFMLMVGAASGQVLMTPTNVRDTVQSGPAYTLSGVAGAYRITYTVESTAGVPLSLDDGSALRLYVWGADGHLVSSNSPSVQPLAPLSDGKVKFTFANISAGEYRIQGVATPASGDTNENWNFTHHMLTVTSTPSAAIGNFTVQWEIEGDGDLAPAGVNRDVEPYSDLGADLGSTNKRWNSIHSSTVRVDKIIAAEADLGAVIGFVDSTKVALLGETNAVILTGTTVQARSPTSDVEVATKGYVDAVAGGELNVGPVQLYTNHVGDVGRTNAAGYFENINDHTPLVGTNIIFNRTYDGGRTWSNLNVTGSAWQNGETNGRGWARGPSENASGRFFDYNAVPTGVPVRCSVDIITPLQSTLLANGTWTWGLSWRDIGGTNNTLISVRATSGSELIETYIYNLSYSAGQDTRPIAPYNAGNVTLNTYNFGFKDLIFAMDHNGAGTVRYYINGALVYRATNVTPVAGFSIHASMSSAPANSTNTSDMVWDNFRGEYGLWTEAW